MTVFVDTSAFLALGEPADPHHDEAVALWTALLLRRDRLITSNYVVVETVSLMHHRFGVPAIRTYVEDVLPTVVVDWVDEDMHSAALGAVMAGGRRGPSIVDSTSFEMMRRRHLTTALAFDQHFTERGYTLPAVDAAPGPDL